uniref:Uncharacterized protein n=1 Tax=Candidatus Kentrum eta TaxID=2126337 RepID=A0A450VHD2_9GAMM|nr:MAG: hypothetical protein BECKH772A_GA0070896_101654 [Candidatus Kentron sp. H]VFJ99671.1 MAG: hypothetical protein BECKH772B_GA0070898_101654 [Candidatus Kentron sp. H]VFK04226.1 MAG: hypothetical protein BECKH772C_GA0070978_101684 [Candidatus Kentron sp. H]
MSGMNAYKTYAEIDAAGRMVIEGLPFPKGVPLEVLIVDRSRRSNEKVASWRALMDHVRGLPQSANVSEKAIAIEIDRARNAP